MRKDSLLLKVCLLTWVALTSFLFEMKPSSAAVCTDELIKEKLMKITSVGGIKATDDEVTGVILSFRPCCEEGSPSIFSYTFENKSHEVNCALLDLPPGSGMGTPHGVDAKVAEEGLKPVCRSKDSNLSETVDSAKSLAQVANCVDRVAENPKLQLLGWNLIARVVQNWHYANFKKEMMKSETDPLGELHPVNGKVRAETNSSLLRLEILGVDSVDMGILLLHAKKDPAELKALQKLLSPVLASDSKAHKSPGSHDAMLGVLSSYIKLTTQTNEPFHLSLKYLSDTVSHWSSKSQKGLSNVLARAANILEKKPGFTPEAAFEASAKEYKVWDHIQVCSK